MARRILAAALAAALLAPISARADTFRTSFPAAKAASWLEGAERGVIVVGAGAATADRDEAVDSLTRELRESGRFPLVMDGASLGDMATADDKAIVQSAAHLPVDRIAVVRVYPASAGAPATAVVSVYDSLGRGLEGFSIRAGEALDVRLAGATRTEVAHGELATGHQATTRADAQAIYDERYVWFEDRLDPETDEYGGTLTQPMQGKYARRLDGAEFYELVGRPELASAYRSRRGWKTGLLAGGVLMGLAGAALLYPLIEAERACEVGLDDPGCGRVPPYDPDTIIPLSIGLIGVGSIVAIAGLAIEPHPVESHEARRLADEFNGKLKEDLGLRAARERKQEPAVQVNVGLAAYAGGGGLALSGRF